MIANRATQQVPEDIVLNKIVTEYLPQRGRAPAS